MSVWSLSDVFRQKDKNASYINEPENEFREGILFYFIYFSKKPKN